MVKIKKLSVWSLGVYAALASVIVLLVNMASNYLLQALATKSPAFLSVLYWNVTLSQAVIAALLAFIGAVIVVAVYNLVAKYAGGISVDLSGKK